METAAGAHPPTTPREMSDFDVSTMRERFFRGAPVPGRLRPEIGDSWRRCRDTFGVPRDLSSAPDGGSSGRYSVDDAVLFAELAGRVASRESEAAVARAVIALSDGMGRVVGTWSDSATMQSALRRNLAPRSCWSEEASGTNGIGVALECDEMVTVKGAEHWCGAFAEWSSVAVAVRDPATGRPMAAVMVSSCHQLPPLAATWVFEIVQGGRWTAPMRVVGAAAAAGRDRTNARSSPTLGPGVPELRRNGPTWQPVARSPVRPAQATRAPAPEHATDSPRARANWAEEAMAMPRRVIGTKDQRQVLFAAAEVAVAEASGRIVWLVTDRGRYRCATEGLERLERELAGSGFMRVHRRYLVNLGRVREVERKDGGELALVIDRGGGSVPVSRRRATLVTRALGL